MRNEYPRPQLVRVQWTNLNGEWDFAFDFTNSLVERHPQTQITANITYFIAKEFPLKIKLPFCPESPLSGIGHTDFIGACWYRKVLRIQKKEHKRYLLHLQAAFHTTHIFANDKLVLVHKGGYTPFTADLTDEIADGAGEVKIHCYGDPRDGTQPSGKQSPKNEAYGCYYTRCTGIWQTVWLEEVEENYLRGVDLTPDVDNCALIARLRLAGVGNKKITLTASYGGETVGTATVESNGRQAESLAVLPLNKLELWNVGDPKLYDLKIEIASEHGVDYVQSYFGMRKLELDEKGLLINGKRVFQRLVLDQGYYPDGIYTAPDYGQLRGDVERAISFGFNGARLHQKVFEEGYLYAADQLGFLVWGEYPSWGFDHSDGKNFLCFLPEWLEAVERDYNHPSVIAWCPMNENFDYQGKRQNRELVKEIYLQTKSRDATRPCIDVSWNYHVQTDIYDIHDYTQQTEEFAKRFAQFEEGKAFDTMELNQAKYGGEPFVLSEYGGFRWPNDAKGWGYNDEEIKSEVDFAKKLASFQEILYGNPRICGACYTQLYDVEQEVNGLYYYDRTAKFDGEAKKIIAEAMKQTSSYEKLGK